MKDDVGEMMPAGVETKELAIQHVRKTSDGEPVRGIAGSDRPLQASRRDALAHVRILGDVFVIVVVDKVEVPHLGIHGERCQKQDKVNQEVAARGYGMWFLFLNGWGLALLLTHGLLSL